MIFLTVLPALEVRIIQILQKYLRCKMTEKGPKNIDQIIRTLYAQSNRQWVFDLSQELKDLDFQTNAKMVLNPKAISVPRISLTRGKLHFLYFSV